VAAALPTATVLRLFDVYMFRNAVALARLQQGLRLAGISG
jgi:hypothetical protein